MKKLIIITISFFTLFIFSQESFDKKKDEAYIKRFAKIAVEEMHLYKIPASITLGQGLLETADGQSELAQNANNHFGIKCKENWTGETYRYTDDAYMECFRKYSNAEDSYRDHSQFLLTRKHYASLFLLDKNDYKGWAYGLKKAGYATNPKYPQILIGKIERYNLQNFDKLSVEEVENYLDSIYPHLKDNTVNTIPTVIENKPKPKIVSEQTEIPTYERIKNHKNNNLIYIEILSNETLQTVSDKFQIPLEKLKEYNDIDDDTIIQSGQILFLERKKAEGSKRFHIVAKNETMYAISQDEGILLEALYKINKIKKGQEPKIGQVIRLK